MKKIIICIIVILFSSNIGITQDFFDTQYPAFGYGFNLGYTYYFPKDFNNHIDLLGYSAGDDKEHFHSGITGALFGLVAPNRYYEIVPEIGYLYSYRSFKSYNMTSTMRFWQFGATVFYKMNLYSNINFRVGAGLINYRGKVKWESKYRPPKEWNGSTFGCHLATGVEYAFNSKTSISFLIFGRYAKIKELKESTADVVVTKPYDDNSNLNLSFSGIDMRLNVNFYL